MSDEAPPPDTTVAPQTPHNLETRIAAYSGPLPPAKELARYAEIQPDLPERIISMAEGEAAHRRAIELALAETDIHNAKAVMDERRRGQHYGLAIAISGLLTAIALAYLGAEKAAMVVGGATVVSLVGAFVAGRFKE